MGHKKEPEKKVGMPKWKPFLDFNPLDLPSLPKKDVTEARIVPTILLRKGYTFEVNSHNKVTMVGPGIRPTELCFGVYNLWFLMHWVEWTTGEAFNQMDDFSIQNKLGEGSVVGYGNDSGSWTNSVYRPTCTGDYWSFSDSGLTKNKGFNFVAIPFRGLAQFSHFGYNELPTYPGVWKRKMDSDTLEERRAWREALEESGFCLMAHQCTRLGVIRNIWRRSWEGLRTLNLDRVTPMLRITCPALARMRKNPMMKRIAT